MGMLNVFFKREEISSINAKTALKMKKEREVELTIEETKEAIKRMDKMIKYEINNAGDSVGVQCGNIYDELGFSRHRNRAKSILRSMKEHYEKLGYKVVLEKAYILISWEELEIE